MGSLGMLLSSGLFGGCGKQPGRAAPERKQNFIILYADDMGYGDWEGGGHPTIRTPNLVRMAREGVTMPQFYSGCPVCTPSRAALLTGRNYIRCGIAGVFAPGDSRGLPPDEITIADALKPLGYATACIGKWHLGDTAETRPLRQGFDFYYGLLCSNNMYDFRLFRNEEVIEDSVNQATLTKRYTEEAMNFIQQNEEKPFFLYLPYTMPHVPVHASEEFLGKSLNGIYGDAVEEIDWSVGRILDTLNRLGLSGNTLVLFSSDNGPAMYKPVPRGSSGIFRGCKGDTWEGGMRVPFIAWQPGKMPAGKVSRAVGSVIDFFPTCAGLAGTPLPKDRPYDGIDLLPVLAGDAAPERTIYYYMNDGMRALRQGKWKLHFVVTRYAGDGLHYGRKVEKLEEPMLFDLEADPSEQYDVAKEHPEIVAKLTAAAQAYREEIARNAENADLIEWFKGDAGKGDHRLTPDN
jgi:arylsulfatase A-like enzyme